MKEQANFWGCEGFFAKFSPKVHEKTLKKDFVKVFTHFFRILRDFARIFTTSKPAPTPPTPVLLGDIHENRKTVRDWSPGRKSKRIYVWASTFCGYITGMFEHSKALFFQICLCFEYHPSSWILDNGLKKFCHKYATSDRYRTFTKSFTV